MKKSIFLFLTLFSISCSQNTDFVPTDEAIFGYPLEKFSKEKLERYGNGECWGTLQEYSKDEIKIVVDKHQCSDYNSNNCYLLFKNEKITTAHTVIFETVMQETTKKKSFSAMESIYNFSSEPPTIFRRTAMVDQQNLALINSVYDTLIMENVAAENVAFTNRLQKAKSQLLAAGEIPLSLTYGDVKVDEKTLAPKIDIFLTSYIFGKTVFLVNDFNLNPIDVPDKRKDFGIPNHTIFEFYSWFAGEGSCYYGVIEKGHLVVYRKLLKELKEDELSFEVFKRFPILNS